MLDMEDIYCYLVSSLTQIEFSEACLRETELRSQLHNLLENAETMHLYIGFQNENAERTKQGLPPLKVEEEFYGHTADKIQLLMTSDGEYAS